MAIRQLLSSSLGIVGGSVVTFVLATFVFPVNFALLFVIAFLLSMAFVPVFAQTKGAGRRFAVS